MSTETTAPAEHKHGFPCNPPGGTYLNPGPCGCGKTYAQGRADEALSRAAALLLDAYGDAGPVSTHWGVGHGSDLASVLDYDSEADANEHASHLVRGFVARRTVITLPWEMVRYDDDEEPAP